MKIILTNHAVERFQERVKPALDLDQAREDLTRLLPNGRLAGPDPGGNSRLEVAPGIYLIATLDEVANQWIALTVAYEGLISDHRRAERNRRRHQRTAAHRLKTSKRLKDHHEATPRAAA